MVEIGVLRGECLDRRIGESERLISEVAAWEKQRNAAGARINWKFTTHKAREKLARAYPCAGSFGSPAGSGVQCGLAVFGEVFESFDGLAAGASDDGEHGVAQRGQNLRRRAGAGAALVLAAGDVANVMQPILDAPVVAREGQQAGGVGLLSG